MRSECIQAVMMAMGRSLTQVEVQGIEDRISRHMRREAAKDPLAAQAMSRNDRLATAAEAASKELSHEAAKKKQRLALTILAHERIAQRIATYQANLVAAKPGRTPTAVDELDAINRVNAFYSDARAGGTSVETMGDAIRDDALRQMLSTLESTNPKFFGLIADNEGNQRLLREMYGEDTGDTVAKAGAKTWHEVAEALRRRFNRSGADIGKRDDWGHPHSHDALRVAKAGKDQWVADTLPHLDRAKFLNEDGARMSDPQMTELLREIFPTIATHGANKIEPGQYQGSAMVANRGGDPRVLHFKSADDYLAYQKLYGKDTLYDSLIHHIHHMAQNIAAVETWGPNPEHTYRFFRDRAIKRVAETDPHRIGKAHSKATGADRLFDYVSGKPMAVDKVWLAKLSDAGRNLQTFAKLGSSVITSLSDEGTLYLTAQLNNLPKMRLLANELAAFNPLDRAERRRALSAGLGMEAYIGTLNRYGDEMFRNGFTRRMASSTLRASGLIAATEARKRAYGSLFMGVIGDLTRHHDSVESLDPTDWRILRSKGITEADWHVWKLADLEDWGGGNDTMLTPDAIYRIPDATLAALGDPTVLKEQAATRLLAAVSEETTMAVIEPGARERSMMRAGFQRGTFGGELWKSAMLFKSFPISMITRHLQRGLSMPTGTGKAAYLATLLAGTTVMGMAALQVNDFTHGRDPRDMTDPRTWGAALLKGGALSIYGDLLFADSTRYGYSALATMEGPLLQNVEALVAMTQGYVVAKAKGEPTHEGARIVRFVKGNFVPNLWYTKAAFNHLVFQRLSEYFSPGYLQRMKKRSREDYHQGYWWEPGESVPERAPNLKNAVGEKP